MNVLTYIPILGILVLSSCSLSDQIQQQPAQTPPVVSLSGNTTGNQPPVLTGAVQVTPEIVTVGAAETKDISLVLVDGKWSLKIQSWTGSRQNIHFDSKGTKTLKVDLQTPLDTKGNVRVAQIIFPDGTGDGPFGKEMTYTLTQSGTYQIILSANMMAGDPWSGELDVNIEVK